MLMISIIKADGETPFQFTKRRLVLKFPITALIRMLPRVALVQNWRET